MGFDENRFSGEVDEEFRCAICQDIVEDPIATHCEHVFCKTCINEWLQKESSCPVDRKPLKSHQLCETSRCFRNFYSKLELKCEYESNGCEMFCKISDLKSHEKKCKYNPILKHECDKGCGAFISVLQKISHNCFEYLKLTNLKLETDLKSTDTTITGLSNRLSEVEESLKNLQIILSVKCDEIEVLQQKINFLSTQSSKTVNNFQDSELENQIKIQQRQKDTSYEQKLLVETLKAKGVLKSSIVAKTLVSVDRNLFCSSDPYSDVPKSLGFGSTISAPHIHAIILELIKDHLKNASFVLDIGSGSGYLTICMALMMGPNGRVIGIDHIKQLIDKSQENLRNNFPHLNNKISFVVSDGRNGHISDAKYDVINIGGAVDEVPQTIIDQLKSGGRIIAPIGPNNRRHQLITIDKLSDGSIKTECHQNSFFGYLKDLESQLNDTVIPIPGFPTFN